MLWCCSLCLEKLTQILEIGACCKERSWNRWSQKPQSSLSSVGSRTRHLLEDGWKVKQIPKDTERQPPSLTVQWSIHWHLRELSSNAPRQTYKTRHFQTHAMMLKIEDAWCLGDLLLQNKSARLQHLLSRKRACRWARGGIARTSCCLLSLLLCLRQHVHWSGSSPSLISLASLGAAAFLRFYIARIQIPFEVVPVTLFVFRFRFKIQVFSLRTTAELNRVLVPRENWC